MCRSFASCPAALRYSRASGSVAAAVRGVRPLLAAEVDVRVPRLEAVRRPRPRLAAPGRSSGRHRAEALDRGEALDQRAIDAEVLAAQAGRQRLPDDRLRRRRPSARARPAAGGCG